MKFIKLTIGTDDTDDEVFVNVKYIYWFYSYRGATSTFMSTLKDNLNVKETPEKIIQLIKQEKEIWPWTH